MRKSIHASTRVGISAIAAIAIVFGGLAVAPATADELLPEESTVESVETTTPDVEHAGGDETASEGEQPEATPTDDPAVEFEDGASEETGDETSVEDGSVEEPSEESEAAPTVESTDELVALETAQVQVADTFRSVASSVAAGNVQSGTASWGLSTYLATTAATGSLNTLPSGYVSPASFDMGTSTASWGSGHGTVQPDGSAVIGFAGASLNYAATGNRWLKLADLEATLDASGNGTVTALVSYGPGIGSYPSSSYDPTVAAYRGPSRVNILTLTGNSSAQFGVSGDTATWTALAGAWHDDLNAFLAGGTPALSYRSQIHNSAPANRPQPISFQLGVRPTAADTVTALSASPSSLIATGTAVTLAANVSPVASGTITFREGSTILGSPIAVDGSGSASLAIGAPGVGSHGYTATFTPTDSLAFAGSVGSVSVTVTAAPTPAPGSLAWAIKASFNDYVVNGQAHGSISVSGGASGAGVYRFPQAAPGDWSPTTQLGSVPYAGSVRYFGHGGDLDLTLSSPTITVNSASSATLWFNGSTFATLNLAAASKSVGAGGDVTWSGAPATLTSSGASLFAGYYSAGEALDPVTFTAGSTGSVGSGTTTVAAAETRTPAATPPATTGITVTSGAPAAGGTVTFEAEGFGPNEEGILVVIYSDPVVLGTTKSDANGVVRWTGRLPVGLTGSHTLTLQGSVSRGVVVNIRPAVLAAAGSCTIEDAALTWGFKESFRSYISGTIANGEWTVADGATYDTPSFSWEGFGSLDPDSETGDLAFTGSIRFTGHDGALDTTIANPRIVFGPDGDAVLLLDVTGVTQAGEPVAAMGVEFASLDLGAVMPETSDGIVSWDAIPAELTAAGSAAFGTYPEGEALDPVQLTVELPTGCGEVVASEPTESAVPIAAETDAAPGASDLTWIWWLVGGLIILAGIIVTMVIITRRRSA